jgi:hypothetical protein
MRAPQYEKCLFQADVARWVKVKRLPSGPQWDHRRALTTILHVYYQAPSYGYGLDMSKADSRTGTYRYTVP